MYIEKIAVAAVRSIITSMTLEDILISRTQINKYLKEIIEETVTKWGVTVLRTELQDIDLPKEV